MKLRTKEHFIFCFVTILLSLFSCSKKVSVKPIEQDCALLKQYLEEASVDVSLAVEAGLDLNKVIDELKKYYLYYAIENIKEYHEESDEKGIYRNAFADSISQMFVSDIPFTNTHNNVKISNYSWNPIKTKFAFPSEIFFEFRDGYFFVVKSNCDSVKVGMRYTGDYKNMIKVIDCNMQIKYQYVWFYEYDITNCEINVDNEQVTIPISYQPFYSDRCEDISYEIKDDFLFIHIKTFFLHGEKSTKEFNKIVEEVAGEINKYSNIIIDLRDNPGGNTNLLYPIIYSLVLGCDYYKKQESCNVLDKVIYAGSKYLNTKVIRTQIYLLGEMVNLFNQHIGEKYIEIEYSDNYPFYNFKPVFEGKIFVLMNTGTTSAAEHFIAILNYFFQNKVILIGEKTYGCLDFGNVMDYRLRDSGIVISLSSVDNRSTNILKDNKKWHGDTQGFYPDYWCFINDEDVIRKLCLSLSTANN